jgi:predicted MFS family arabinose efflux permease
VQDRALAAISSGTGWGVALAVPIALVAGAAWRSAWVAFAVLAVAALLWSLRALPGRISAEAASGLTPLRPSWFVCPRSGPLLAAAFLVGLGSSAYWTFAVDHVVQAGDASPGDARLLLAVVGVASILGTLGADLVRLVGGRAGMVGTGLTLSASLLLLGLAPGSWPVVLLSALMFGAAYNLVVTIQVLWSAIVFADRPSAGLAGVAVLLGLGMLAGPLVGGALAGPLGMDGVFVAAAGVIALVGLLAPRERLSPVPARS